MENAEPQILLWFNKNKTVLLLEHFCISVSHLNPPVSPLHTSQIRCVSEVKLFPGNHFKTKLTAQKLIYSLNRALRQDC